MQDYSIQQILCCIDHAVLKQDALISDIQNACKDATEYGFYSVIVHPYYTQLTSKLLAGSKVLCGTVVGFPFGNNLSATKSAETYAAIAKGAQEIDMVMTISALKNQEYAHVLSDIQAVVKAAEGIPVKVILETPLLTPEEIAAACNICMDSGAAFVKTATGYFGGAKVEDVALMKRVCGDKILVKASGGIRSAQDARAMLSAGAVRLGTSAGIAIAKGGLSSQDY